MNGHTVSAYDAELKELNDLVLMMGDAVAKQLKGSIGIQRSQNAAEAEAIIEADRRVDALQARIEEKVVTIIAKRQPMAVDLRTIIATLKMATDFERIGDLAKNNAKRVLATAGQHPPQPELVANLERLGKLVIRQVDATRAALERRDQELAVEVWSRDGEVDDMQTSLFRELLTYMMEDPRTIGVCTHLLFCARNLERIGDHATNIAEHVHFIVAGKALPLDRPRGAEAAGMPA